MVNKYGVQKLALHIAKHCYGSRWTVLHRCRQWHVPALPGYQTVAYRVLVHQIWTHTILLQLVPYLQIEKESYYTESRRTSNL